MFHWLPHKAMPRIMCQAAGMIAAHQLNLLPANGRLSPYYSPNVILTGEPLDYNKHFQIPFESYVQANHKPNPNNTTAPRTLDAIYLQPTGNLQGVHELIDLNSGRLITRARVTLIPITENVIKAVNAMAEEQGIKDLKITNKRGIIYYPADQFAGVDHGPNIDPD